ncbi:hypothetical protein BGZ73_006564 [Actinomortierella ambigua]|nr:hypothetical protein BGZ73_006564 [Actinomortierella ambigua]
MRLPKALLLCSLAAWVTAQQSPIPIIKDAFVQFFAGDTASAGATLLQVPPGTLVDIKGMLSSLEDALGFDSRRHVSRSGLAGGYMNFITGARLFFAGSVPQADNYFKKGAAILKPVIEKKIKSLSDANGGRPTEEHPLDYLMKFLFRFICTNPAIGCTDADKVMIADKTTKFGTAGYMANVPGTPLNIPPYPGGTVPQTVFQDLLNALVKGDAAGATSVISQLTPENVAAIQWARQTMGAFVGRDPRYLHPYGLFAVFDHLSRALESAMGQRDPAPAIGATNNIYVLQPCIEFFNMIELGAVDTMANYLATFFGHGIQQAGGVLSDSDPKYFANAYHLRPSNTPPPGHFRQDADTCKARGAGIQ